MFDGIKIITSKPVAFDSPDHVHPWGTARDNSVNLAFNRKLFWWFQKNPRVFDLGCSGGGFVKSILDRNGFAVGIEGSDYSKKNKRAEWATIPNNLFIADITEPFKLLKDNKIVKFNVITAWEVIEHIKEDKLKAVFDNINLHLSQNGVVIVSVSTKNDIVGGLNLHQTVQSKEWWIEKFTELGFKCHEKPLKYFGYDWIRGAGIDDEASFNVVLTRKNKELPYRNRLIFLKIIVWPSNIAKRFLNLMYKKILHIIPQRIKQSIKNSL